LGKGVDGYDREKTERGCDALVQRLRHHAPICVHGGVVQNSQDGRLLLSYERKMLRDMISEDPPYRSFEITPKGTMKSEERIPAEGLSVTTSSSTLEALERAPAPAPACADCDLDSYDFVCRGNGLNKDWRCEELMTFARSEDGEALLRRYLKLTVDFVRTGQLPSGLDAHTRLVMLDLVSSVARLDTIIDLMSQHPACVNELLDLAPETEACPGPDATAKAALERMEKAVKQREAALERSLKTRAR